MNEGNMQIMCLKVSKRPRKNKRVSLCRSIVLLGFLALLPATVTGKEKTLRGERRRGNYNVLGNNLMNKKVNWKPLMLINSGSQSSYTDSDGNLWKRDQYFNSGSIHKSKQDPFHRQTEDESLYLDYRKADKQTSRLSKNLSYKIPVPNGSYKVELHWAEMQKTQKGKRVFHVHLNSKRVLKNLDVFAAGGGRYQPVSKELYTTVTDGYLRIVFEPKIDEPFISAIGVYTKSLVTSSLPQPKVTVVEKNPARKAQGTVSIPEGSTWCNGGPTFWWIGHDNLPETPACQNKKTGEWSYPEIAALDQQDALNIIDGPSNIDRHDCTLIDMNEDNIMDLVCVVGANKGKGKGFNEVYITQPDGSVKKILKGHGLQKYPTSRTRMVITLTAANGKKLVMIANEGHPRTDGMPNEHRMFRLETPASDNNPIPLFEEVDPHGPWVQTFVINCLVGGDLNNDGIDDFIMCDEDGPAQLFVQHANGSWDGINLKPTGLTGMTWNNVRVADVTGDGVADLIACGPFQPWKKGRDDPFVRIFKGVPGSKLLFNFATPYFEWRPDNEPLDVEVMDLNGDGLLDIYVVLMDRSEGTYCRESSIGKKTFVPPLDKAHDYVLVGQANKNTPFVPVELFHEQPGCGSHAAKWGNQSLVVHQGDLSHFGYGLLLEW